MLSPFWGVWRKDRIWWVTGVSGATLKFVIILILLLCFLLPVKVAGWF